MARPARLSSTLRTSGERTERRASRLNSAVSMPIGNTPMRTVRSGVSIGEFSALRQPAFVLEIAREIVGVVLGLEADQIVGAQLRDEPFVVRQRGENLRRRKRNVQEEADAVAMPAVAQHLRERDEMIVVHPDDVVGLQEIVQLSWRNAR